ncbi:hypothetical protein Q763_01410 [Flavobacterium beibuense F44-8]|uniref:Late embryogenesis abundant protein LEA-2 subgroup domain-containing protein n=1 Tax=Flavobacterium beibuense F44-8 TaxID=1406840 RepID=A0A0A2LWP3_9FLAO|nr:hypothetical protein [Flavobacterium beibuense]KGO84429.1 hypothetical protein Q763_01410 [Flavobacterium beibuense F44-8]
MKKTIVIAGLIIGGIAYASYRKVQKLKEIFNQMKIQPSGLRNVKIGVDYFTFNLDLTIENPTTEAFSLNAGSTASFKRVLAYRNGHFLGMATLNLNMVNIPAFNSFELKNVPFQISSNIVIQNALSIESFSVEQLTFVVVVDILGKEYYIEG